MGGKGKLAAVVGSKTMETHMAWYNSCKSMLEKDYPDITFVSDEPYEDNNDDDTARKVATEILNAHPDITGFFGTSVSAGSNMGRLGVLPMQDMLRSNWPMTRSKANPSRQALI